MMHLDAKDHVLYDGGRAPNPRRVAMFLREKGIEVTIVPVDMGAMDHKSDSIRALNPLMQMPLLQLPDGDVLTETVAICRYFEMLYPTQALLGVGAKGAAVCEMWQRRVELQFLMPVAQAFRHTHPAMKEWEVPQVVEWGEANRPKAQAFARLLNNQLADNEFIAGDAFSIADITGIIAVDFSKPARIQYEDDLTHFHRWVDATRARASYQP